MVVLDGAVTFGYQTDAYRQEAAPQDRAGSRRWSRQRGCSMQDTWMPQVGRGKLRYWLLALCGPALMLSGCEGMNNTDKGVLAGGGLGAATGAIIGSATGHAGAGTAIGAALGGIAGGLTGNAIDKSEERQETRAAAIAAANKPASAPLSIVDIANLAQQRVTDGLIINQIRTTGSTYRLTAQDIMFLKNNQVSDQVIAEMQSTAARVPVTRMYSPTPPPPQVGVSIGYQHYR